MTLSIWSYRSTAYPPWIYNKGRASLIRLLPPPTLTWHQRRRANRHSEWSHLRSVLEITKRECPWSDINPVFKSPISRQQTYSRSRCLTKGENVIKASAATGSRRSITPHSPSTLDHWGMTESNSHTFMSCIYHNRLSPWCQLLQQKSQ